MNILLLEPDYKTSYPPIGLMKLAYYHKEFKGDFVWFSKGQKIETCKTSNQIREKIRNSKYYNDNFDVEIFIEESEKIIEQKKWDRIYITTLFTYEWKKTIELIEYAKTLVDCKDKIFVGGILATLMPEEIYDATGIRPHTGQITSSFVLGFDDDVNIDTLTPDYSILDLVDYNYEKSDCYITTATRGCGMKCSFCAVQKLEPDCVDYISIERTISEIDEKYGGRLHLLLMDNNVLKSSSFDRIIEDIIRLGFGKNDKRINPKTGKLNKVYVDFNQGLDMNFITAHKMKQLSKLAINPVRIAFDHIDDKEKYMAAMRLANKNEIDIMSNYMLYNTDDFKGKGVFKHADTPKDLYDRLRVNVDLQAEFNRERKRCGKKNATIYSFAMKFIPLSNTDRNYVGKNWTIKQIRALQLLIYSARGIIYSGEKCFKKTFGDSFEEFERYLQMPIKYLEKKGKHSNNSWQTAMELWENQFLQLTVDERKNFINIISDNSFDANEFSKITVNKIKELYIHYLHSIGLLDFLEKLKTTNSEDYYFAKNYILSNSSLIKINIQKFNELKCSNQYLATFISLLYCDNEYESAV